MAGPRLITLSCPQCGAALQVGRGDEVATCGYCRQSSFVHWPDRPRPTAPATPGFGNIHVPPAAVAVTSQALLVVILASVMAMLIGGLVWTTASNTSTSIPVTRPIGTGGPSCERAVACCRVISPNSGSGCDAMRLMSDSDCVKQVTQLSAAAKAIGKSCK